MAFLVLAFWWNFQGKSSLISKGKRQKKPPTDFAPSPLSAITTHLEVKSSAPFLNELLDNSNPILEVISGRAAASNTKAKSWDFMGSNAWTVLYTFSQHNAKLDTSLLSSLLCAINHARVAKLKLENKNRDYHWCFVNKTPCFFFYCAASFRIILKLLLNII